MTISRLLSEALSTSELPSTGDVLSIGLPFLRQIDEVHQQGRVSRLSGTQGVSYDGTVLRLDPSHHQPPRLNIKTVRELNPQHTAPGVEVLQRLESDLKGGAGSVTTSLDVTDGIGRPPDRPVLVVGYRAWEQLCGHHDVLTDIHLAGMILTSYATGLDFDAGDAISEFAIVRRHLSVTYRNLHPVVAGVLSDMTSPDRHRRPREMGEVLARLENHRDLPTDLDLDQSYQAAEGWRQGVLKTLRDRVFDVSRRNRALYFKPSATALSLTEASVPLILSVDRIRPEDLLTWTGDAAKRFRSGRFVDLERWCRFEEFPHLEPGLDKIISAERALRSEHGQGRLRLIIAFLRWVDVDTGEVIHSPFVTVPAELSRKKGVKNRYLVRVDDQGEINPVLRHLFATRFGISLPESVATDHDSIVQLVDEFGAMVRSTDKATTVELIDTPRVDIIRRRAQIRVDAYLRRRARALAASGRWRRQTHSYEPDDWRPLGLGLFQNYVRSADLPLRDLAGAPPRPRQPNALSATSAPLAIGERTQSQYAPSSEANRHRWEVDLCSVTLASLGSRRSSLSRDYNSLLDEPPADPGQTNTPFDLLFSPNPKAQRRVDTEPTDIGQVLVLPADDTQARAVRRVLDGESLIIQGPPGTGKSQTIANMIAAFVADGRRVLFVCEKRAALDVVAHRLRQVGLGQLVATIHDSQLDRRAFIADLAQVYNAWLLDDDEPGVEDRQQCLDALESVLNPLRQVFGQFGDQSDHGVSLGDVVERLVLLRTRGVLPHPDTCRPPVETACWLEARPLLDNVATELVRTGRSGPLGQLSVLRVNPTVVTGNDPLDAVRALGRVVAKATDELVSVCGNLGLDSAVAVASIEPLAQYIGLVKTLNAAGALTVVDESSVQHHNASQAAVEIERLGSQADRLKPVLDRWHKVPDAIDAANALTIAKAKEGSLLRILNGGWRQVRNMLKQHYRYDLHQIAPPASQILSDLVAVHEANSALEAQIQQVVDTYGVADIQDVLVGANALSNDPIGRALGREGLVIDLAALGDTLGALEPAISQLIIGRDASLADLSKLGHAMQNASVGDEQALVSWARLAGVDNTVLEAALDQSATLDEIEATVLQGSLTDPRWDLSSLSVAGPQLDQTVDELLDRYQTLLRANASMVASQARTAFKHNIALSEASMAGRSDDDKQRKRSIRAGRKLLEREFEKKMRFRSIRELASGDCGAVVRDLKPIWLMSPLSVSNTLPLDSELFDVVVFDEASQIPVEDAVPTLFRAQQTVVVGDRMQMPPTRFFSTGSDHDDEAAFDDEGHRIAITLDSDSFLTQADLALDSTMLSWHYRSRYESLIGYSNHAFYGGRLATIPDRTLELHRREPIVSTGADDANQAVLAALNRPISFHAISDGVYEGRRNYVEADYIAELVRAMLASDIGHTIGIVAFSEAQQDAIESSLAELAVIDPVFGERLEAEQDRTEDGEFVGLFIKNLENVQGDERDIIIMSVCYGPNRDGKMRMNFGPINQQGGERRLNVIFSRAKRHMMVISSIKGSDITNTHNEGAAHLAQFLDYAAAESVGGSGGERILRSLNPDRRAAQSLDSHDSVAATEIAKRLRSRGLEADVNVGRSTFTIDVAVRVGQLYILGIIIDPGTSNDDPTSRMIVEAGVLQSMNWPITRVLISDWWASPDHVVDRIVHKVETLTDEPTGPKP